MTDRKEMAELISFLDRMTPAEVERITANLDTVERIAKADDYTARVIAGFAAKLTESREEARQNG